MMKYMLYWENSGICVQRYFLVLFLFSLKSFQYLISSIDIRLGYIYLISDLDVFLFYDINQIRFF